MGLEIVEIIMRVEEEFAIEILDSEAELLATPGALCDLIESKLSLYRPHSSSSCPTSLAFYSVRRELMQQGIERHRIKPNTLLAELWPVTERRSNWHALEAGLHYHLPPLRRSRGWTFIGLLPIVVLPFDLWASPNTAITFLGFFAFYFVLLWFGAWITEQFAVHPTVAMYSIADLSHNLAPRFRTSADVPSLGIWEQLRTIIAEECGVPIEKITRDADWVRDLGLG